MQYDIHKLTQPQYVNERSFSKRAEGDVANNGPFHKPSHNADNFSGLFVNTTASGMANASVVSPSASPEEYIYFIPEFAPIPEVEMEKQHVASNMEKAVEIVRDNRL